MVLNSYQYFYYERTFIFMENNTTIETKKYFSRMGMTLFLGSLLIYAVQIIFLTIAQNIPVIAKDVNLSFLMGMLPMYIIAFPLIFLMFKRIPAQPKGEKQKMNVWQILAAFCVGYAILNLFNILGSILVSIVCILKKGGVNNVVTDITTSVHPLISFLIVAICGPIMEELLFRKTILDRTRQYGDGLSLLFSGLVFGLFHGNLAQFVYTFFLGIFLGYIYIKTENIVYTIILHIMINFPAAVLWPFVLKKSGLLEMVSNLGKNASSAALTNALMDNPSGTLLYTGYMCFVWGIVILGVILFFVNKKKLSLDAGKVTIEKGARFQTILLNVGMILYCILWILMIIRQLIQ